MKSLLGETDELLGRLDARSKQEVQLSEKLLGADMQRLVDSMKLAMQYQNTVS